MLDEDSCCVLESLLGMNAPVSGDLEGQLLVVSLLLYTIVLREVLDITDRRIDRVDSDRLQLILLSRVDQLLISGDVPRPLLIESSIVRVYASSMWQMTSSGLRTRRK